MHAKNSGIETPEAISTFPTNLEGVPWGKGQLIIND